MYLQAPAHIQVARSVRFLAACTRFLTTDAIEKQLQLLPTNSVWLFGTYAGVIFIAVVIRWWMSFGIQ